MASLSRYPPPLGNIRANCMAKPSGNLVVSHRGEEGIIKVIFLLRPSQLGYSGYKEQEIYNKKRVIKSNDSVIIFDDSVIEFDDRKYFIK